MAQHREHRKSGSRMLSSGEGGPTPGQGQGCMGAVGHHDVSRTCGVKQIVLQGVRPL